MSIPLNHHPLRLFEGNIFQRFKQFIDPAYLRQAQVMISELVTGHLTNCSIVKNFQ
jgi:hypothetical protein